MLIIAAAIALNLMLTLAAHAAFLFWLKPYIDRKMQVKLAHSNRRVAAHTRQTTAAVDRAVEGFSAQARFVDERSQLAVEECIKALRVTRRETLEDVRHIIADLRGDKDRPSRTPMHSSVRQILKDAEQRMVDNLKTEAIQPQQG